MFLLFLFFRLFSSNFFSALPISLSSLFLHGGGLLGFSFSSLIFLEIFILSLFFCFVYFALVNNDNHVRGTNSQVTIIARIRVH